MESISIHLGWGMSITMASRFAARQTSSRTDWGARILICWSAEKWRLWKLSTTLNQSKPTFLDGVCSSVPATNRPLPELFVSHWDTHKQKKKKKKARKSAPSGLNAALVMLGMVTESVVVVSMAYRGEIVEAHTAWWWDRHREKVYSLAKWLGEERVELWGGGGILVPSSVSSRLWRYWSS